MNGKRDTRDKRDRDGLRGAVRGAWALGALALLAVAPSALANHVQVTNVELVNGGRVQFDISWGNSWRESWVPVGAAEPVQNWDAAWVFVKFRKAGETVYSHATLSTTTSHHSVPVGAALDVGLTAGRTPGEGVGVFIYRDAVGWVGDAVYNGVQLKWMREADGVAVGENVDIQVHAIEMVYVPEGAFRVGTGVDEKGSFKNGTTDAAFLVDATWSGPVGSDPNARRIGNVDGQLWGYSTSGTTTIGPEGALHDNFLTGYSAFYCMKHKITQGQYAAFLNSTLIDAHYPKESRYRYALTGPIGSITTVRPDVACNFLSWADVAAYKAWAGLRPMTELEFEKACRGPVEPVAGEFAWGSTSKTYLMAPGIVDGGREDERASSSAAKFRGSGRVAPGASYWGIMELTADVWDRAVGVAADHGDGTGGRQFQGTHGSGTTALPADWPDSNGIGAGFRGGVIRHASVSDRSYAAVVSTQGHFTRGSRAVRSAPSRVAATQAAYYVSPTGSDTNDGISTSTPFATIAKARDVVRTINSNMTGDIIVYLMDGTHTLSSTLTLGTSDSGTNGYKVIYRAYTDATPVISGGVDVTTGWTLHDAGMNIYKKTGVNWNFRQLYVNNQRAVRARTPNLENLVTGGPFLRLTNEFYPFEVDPSDIGSWANNGVTEMVVRQQWSEHRGRISSYTSEGTVYFQSPESGFRWNHHTTDKAPYYFENAYELLDAEGEWFLDTAATTLYYKPRAGETMNTTQIIAPKVETLVNIEGTDADSKARNIQFYGITFKHSSWLAPSSYGYVNVQAGLRYQTVAAPNPILGGRDNVRAGRCRPPVSMFQLKYTRNVTLENNTFQFAGGWGVMGYEGTENTSILWNTFYQNAGGGIAMGVVGDQWGYQPIMTGQSNYDTISYNTVDSIGRDYSDMIGIAAKIPKNMTIARNLVKNLRYTGISIGWNWRDDEVGMTNNHVIYNRIHDVMRYLEDGGAIYTLGRMTNSTFSHNYIYNVGENVYRAKSDLMGIYLDNGSCYKLVEHNVINKLEQWNITTFHARNPPNHNNIFRYNYTNYPSFGDPRNTAYDNTLVSEQDWPQAALDIMNASGPGN